MKIGMKVVVIYKLQFFRLTSLKISMSKCCKIFKS